MTLIGDETNPPLYVRLPPGLNAELRELSRQREEQLAVTTRYVLRIGMEALKKEGQSNV